MGRFRVTSKRYFSDFFALAIRKSSFNFNDLALKSKINPDTLGNWYRRFNRAPIDDQRIYQLAEIIDVPKEKIFDDPRM